jgi:hypothetical protein
VNVDLVAVEQAIVVAVGVGRTGAVRGLFGVREAVVVGVTAGVGDSGMGVASVSLAISVRIHLVCIRDVGTVVDRVLGAITVGVVGVGLGPVHLGTGDVITGEIAGGLVDSGVFTHAEVVVGIGESTHIGEEGLVTRNDEIGGGNGGTWIDDAERSVRVGGRGRG